MAPPKAAQLQKGRDFDLAKPFDKDTRRILQKTAADLMRKRGKINSKMTMALERPTQSSDVQDQQDFLLQLSLREKAKEKKFIRRQTKVLEGRQKMLDMDPSDARERDVDLLKSLLSKLRDESSTSSEGLKHKSKNGDVSSVEWDTEDSEDDNDDYHSALENDLSASPLKDKDVAVIGSTKKEKRKRDDDTPQSSKKWKNGHFDKDNQLQGEKAQHDGDSKRKKKHKKSKNISLNEMSTEDQHDIPKANSHSITTNDVEHAEDTGSGTDVAKGLKKTKKKKSSKSKSKSKSATAHPIEHGNEADFSEVSPVHQKAEGQKNASASTAEVKGKELKKKHKKSRSSALADVDKEEQEHGSEAVPTPEVFERKDTPVLVHEAKNGKKKKKQKKTKHAEFSHAVTVIDDVNEHEHLSVAEASPGGEDAKDGEVFQKYKKPKKVGHVSDNVVAKDDKANTERDTLVHNAKVDEPTTIEGKKRKKLRSTSLSIAEKDEQSASPDKIKDSKTSVDGPQKAMSSPSTALKGPTRIPIPATPDNRGSFIRTAGRTPFNPFLNLKPHSVQHPAPSFVPEKSPKSPDGQVWVLDTTGSRKQNKNHEDDAKSVTMTIGKVDTPHKFDQGSPTPPPKKEQKKRGRPKKVKEPLAPVSPHRAGSSAKATTPRARASSDLAALLGSPKRAKKLQKVLKEDKAMLEQEKKSWYKAVGLDYEG
ncbi:hypothetical protein CABS01_12517 [Colletotrichum abscissum]|uniref:Uncharacterized protein n=1 Tax=Colletotrichum abscissum TaxID=1671311 RepID=A0A9Q0B2X0_9PEZI|nr:uncharacterized protein CABS01_12517 [Colletotrichum abscissum]KAI3544378.1 hypothetical protein CABS02_09780 [Colletotrichum abscissum]KAK1489936.1 hypothetical protein CABS01_12517 [Colletotrichum abscissum]